MEYIKVTKIDCVTLKRRNIESTGTLHLTTHHLIFTFNNREIWICYPILAQVIQIRDSNTLKLNCKDFQFLQLKFQSSQQCQDVYDSIFNLTIVSSTNQLYAFNYQPNQIEYSLNSWKIYKPLKEFERQGLRLSSESSLQASKDNWRLTTLNSDYSFSPSYPSLLLVPKTISDTVLKHASKFRSKGRIPALSYYYKTHGTSITRCSQPLTGLKQSRSIQDEKLVMEIFRASELSNNKNIIVDCRPQTNAMAQTALGAGSEIMDNYPQASKMFLGIDNIHVMRESLNKLNEQIQDFSKPLNHQKLIDTKWLKFISILLSSLERLTKYFIFNKVNLLVHCSDGWDRTSQISSLLQICIDPYYRTLDGFIVLIEKDWLSFGHRFNERSGHVSSASYFSSEDNNEIEDGAKKALKSVTSQFKKLRQVDLTSPIFHQFLDTVYQIQRQYPNKFEFNERFLRRLIYHLYSCQYGTFLSNSELEKLSIEDKTRSVWDYFLSRREEFTNKEYETTPVEFKDDYIIPNYKDIKWWWQLYGRSNEEMNGNVENLSGNELSSNIASNNNTNNNSSSNLTESKEQNKTITNNTSNVLKTKEDRMKGLTPPPEINSLNNKVQNYYNQNEDNNVTELNSKFETMDVVS